MGGNVAENLSNQSVPEAAARVAAVVNRLVNRIGSNAESRERLAEIEIPEELRDNLALFLRLERRVLSEYDPEIADLFDKILTAEIVVNAGNPGTCAADEAVDEQGVPTADEPTAVAFREVVDLIDSLPLDKQQVIVRAFTSFFHLANLSEENYRVAQLREREAGASTDTEVDPANELTVAYHQLVNELGVEGANELLDKLEFHPVFTAHPTEARRKAVEGKIRRISNLLEERPRLGGSDLVENERHMLQEIDALVRTSPIALKKPTPVEEADTIIDIFDNTLFDVIPVIYRRFDDWVLGDKAGTVPPLCPAFFHPGSWIGSDRDGNPNVTAKVSREVAAKYFTHMVLKLEDKCRHIGRNLTLEATYSKPSAELINLWNHQVEMSPRYTARAELISEHEPHRAVMLVMADRLNATVRRITDTMYHSADEFLDDLQKIKDYDPSIDPLYTNYAAGWTMTAWDAYTSGGATGDPDWMNITMPQTKDPFQKGILGADDMGPYAVYYILYEAVKRGLTEADPTTTDWEGSKPRINNGQIGAMVLGSWAIVQMQAAGDHADDIGYMPFPITVKGTQYASAGADYCYGVNKNTTDDKKLAAMLYIKWLTESSNFAYDQGGVPVLKSQEYPDTLKAFDGIDLVEDAPAPAELADLATEVQQEAELMLNADQTHVMRVVEAGINGDETLDDIVADWNAAWDAAVDACAPQ